MDAAARAWERRGMQRSTAGLMALFVATVALVGAAFTGAIRVHEPEPKVSPSTFSAQEAIVRRPAAARGHATPAAPAARGHATPAAPDPTTTPAPPAATPVPTTTPAPPAAEPAPTATPAPAALPAPADVVTAYYAALDARRFTTAWDTLSPPVRARFGSFATWRAGYATTVSSRPERIAVTRRGSRATVSLVLAATDRARCGLVHRRFAVRWELAAEGERWLAQTITAARSDRASALRSPAAPRPQARCTAH
jgi:hypothetical protein